jgi:hypothetical protein
MYFEVTVENTGERTTAQGVVVEITIDLGGQWIESLDWWTINYGSVSPGESITKSVIVTMKATWQTAPAGSRVRLIATIIAEETRPEHTVGRRDSGTIEHPGSCTP